MQQSCGSPAENIRVLSAGPEPGLVQQTGLAMFRAPGRSAAWGTPAGEGKHLIQLGLVLQCGTH